MKIPYNNATIMFSNEFSITDEKFNIEHNFKIPSLGDFLCYYSYFYIFIGFFRTSVEDLLKLEKGEQEHKHIDVLFALQMNKNTNLDIYEPVFFVLDKYFNISIKEMKIFASGKEVSIKTFEAMIKYFIKSFDRDLDLKAENKKEEIDFSHIKDPMARKFLETEARVERERKNMKKIEETEKKSENQDIIQLYINKIKLVVDKFLFSIKEIKEMNLYTFSMYHEIAFLSHQNDINKISFGNGLVDKKRSYQHYLGGQRDE